MLNAVGLQRLIIEYYGMYDCVRKKMLRYESWSSCGQGPNPVMVCAVEISRSLSR
jgi:hypothetical protein